eukprot:CAMPEP_0181106828 /NCGR_PEP_ID=MMETSP1071-20121207/16737_1 /TAXON_ID=35127 /ORGANISM="Thalassiosira sp., Strain NH16" /LENGTH=694 /DNA_ID=CAMNT_0023190255 /DNA_START=38 /DNA_END=2122 /DNA_ORIENTATION=+
MAYGITRGPPVEETDLSSFVEVLSTLPAEEWRGRIVALKDLVNSIPDYSTTPPPPPSSIDGEGANDEAAGNGMTNGNNEHKTTPWYRSSKSVRRLAIPLRTLLLDARSAVVKEATELIGTLFMVKLQPHPSLTTDGRGSENAEKDEVAAVESHDGGLETISGGFKVTKPQQPPPPAFVGRLLLKDLLPSILDMSRQTVKVIRTYGVNMTMDVLPHCRVKSCLVVMLERMKTHQNRTVREDCALYLRRVLETWPWDSTGSCDNIPEGDLGIVNSRKEERLSLDSTRQIGLGLGRTLSDSAKPVREEAKRGFQVLFRRFRLVWDEVMSSGVVRDIRLRKKLLEAASRSDGNTANLFDDATSLGEMSLNSAVSGLSYASYRSHASHRSYRSAVGANGVPAVIGTPKTSPRARARFGTSTASPSYMRGTGSSSARISEQNKLQAKEGSDQYSINEYVTSSGHKVSTPGSSRGAGKYRMPAHQYGEVEPCSTPEQPFASLLQTPVRPKNHESSRKVLRKRLSRRISGIKEEPPAPPTSPSLLASISESDDIEGVAPSTVDEHADSSEICNVALEVIAAHLSHLEQVSSFITEEKGILSELIEKLGISITDGAQTSELANRLATLSEEQVCDYFESVHVCVDKQKDAGEVLLKEMERISRGDVSNVSGIEDSPSSLQRQNLPQSPLGDPSLQRNLRDEFG